MKKLISILYQLLIIISVDNIINVYSGETAITINQKYDADEVCTDSQSEWTCPSLECSCYNMDARFDESDPDYTEYSFLYFQNEVTSAQQSFYCDSPDSVLFHARWHMVFHDIVMMVIRLLPLFTMDILSRKVLSIDLLLLIHLVLERMMHHITYVYKLRQQMMFVGHYNNQI